MTLEAFKPCGINVLQNIITTNKHCFRLPLLLITNKESFPNNKYSETFIFRKTLRQTVKNSIGNLLKICIMKVKDHFLQLVNMVVDSRHREKTFKIEKKFSESRKIFWNPEFYKNRKKIFGNECFYNIFA